MTASINFYYMPESPPCRLVEMVSEIVGVKLEKHYINLFKGDQFSDQFIKLNPLHKVPFIVDGEVRLAESRAISMYLVNKYKPNGHSLYPNEAGKRAQVDELLFLDSNQVYASISKVFRPRLFEGAKELNLKDEEAMCSVFKYLEGRLESNEKFKFMLGDELTLGDISLAVSFNFLEANDYPLNNFPALASYLQRLKTSIPNYEKINLEATESMRNYIKLKMSS